MRYIRLLFIIMAGVVLSSSIEQVELTAFAENEDVSPPIQQIQYESPLPLTDDVLALRDRIDNVLISYSEHRFNYSLKIISLDLPQVIYEYKEDEPFMPASNLKIVTTAAGFHFLGAEHHFQTEFYLSSTGDLYIRPSGDPTWNDKYRYKNLDSIFAQIADSLRFHNVKTVKNVLIEKGTYDEYQIENVWKPENRVQSYSAKPSIIAFNDNYVEVRVTPTTAGKPAEVTVYPFDTGWEVINNVSTTSNRRQQGLTYKPDSLANFVEVSGSIYNKSKMQYKIISTPRPDLYALAVLRDKFAEFEIDYSGDMSYVNMSAREFTRSRYERLFSLSSLSLKTISWEINKYSNNFTANQLFMNIGETQGHVWNTENVIKDWLVASGVPILNLKMYDGSGLSPYNRCTTNTLVNILKLMYLQDYYEDYRDTFAIAGVDGTLRRHLSSEILRGNVHAKTGFIQGARGLSGYVTTADDEVLAFSFLANKEGATMGYFYEMAELVLEQVAGFSRN